jgi:hypothetical protein
LYFSEGAFTFGELYEMPIYLRKFYTEKLVAQKQKEDNDVKNVKN